MRVARAVTVLVTALAGPVAAGALEPRFDHRETHGPFAEAVIAHDTLARSGAAASTWRTAARAGWGFDVSGEGDDLLVGATVALRSFDDPQRERVLLGIDVRYRGYFGTEELKTFFDVGAWAPIRSRLAVGPLVGLGVAYDFSRRVGVYLGGSFAAAWGEAWVASFSGSVGAQFRLDI